MSDIINFDNTMLMDIKGCHVMALAKHVYGLRGKKEKLAADMGNVFHEALEHWFRGESIDVVLDVFATEYDKIVPHGEAPAEDRFGRDNCITIMRRYCETMPLSQFPFEPISFEEVKGKALDDKGGFIFWVKQDVVGKDKRSGAITPVDHKTTGNMSSWWARKYRFNSQMTGYCWFCGEEYGSAVDTCYINGIELKKLPNSNKRCSKHGSKYSECGPDHVNFQLFRYRRKQEQLDRWRTDVLLLMKEYKMYKNMFSGNVELLKYAPRTGSFGEACTFCELKEWCTEGFADEWKEEYTMVDPWRPWELPGAKRIDV